MQERRPKHLKYAAERKDLAVRIYWKRPLPSQKNNPFLLFLQQPARRRALTTVMQGLRGDKMIVTCCCYYFRGEVVVNCCCYYATIFGGGKRIVNCCCYYFRVGATKLCNLLLYLTTEHILKNSGDNYPVTPLVAGLGDAIIETETDSFSDWTSTSRSPLMLLCMGCKALALRCWTFPKGLHLAADMQYAKCFGNFR